MNTQRRVRSLQQLMSTPAVLASDPLDVFYYTGFRAGVDDHPLLLVPRAGRPTLIVSPLAGKVRARGAEVSFSLDALKQLPVTVGIDETHLPAGLYLRLRKRARIVPAAETIRKPRQVKDAEEIGLMERAIRIDKKVFQTLDVVGRTERGVAAEIERQFALTGAGRAFETIVASGPNAGNSIHHVPGGRAIRQRDMVIIDFGASWKGYASDITRTLFLRTDRRQQSIVEAVCRLQQECIDLIRPGVGLKEINEFHQQSLRKQGFEVRHGIGHGIGLFVHEPAPVLERGMVVTIEPGVYLRGYGGCRVEDMVLVRSKPRVLSRVIPLDCR